jgi:NADH:ubiquinone oxidoreductase subunit B-like Fe-S oxidoreductase
MGNCAVSGGIFYYDTYSVVRGVDEFLPVDVYIAGCPPRPESLQDAVLRLRERIATESIAPDRRREAVLTLPTVGDISFGKRPGEGGAGEESGSR